MAYIHSPMQNFNRNNPYVIMLKTKYHEITNMLTDVTRAYVWNMFTYSLFAILLCVVLGVSYIILVIPQVLCICGITLYIRFVYRRYMRIYTFNHPSIVAFTKLSNMLGSEINTINHEELLNTLMSIHSVIGEISTVKKSLNQLFTIAILINICVMLYLFIVGGMIL